MKLSIITSVSALALFAATPAFAQTVTQGTADSVSAITQTGNSNVTEVTQRKAGQKSTISQTGNSHRATVGQGVTFTNTASANNTAVITQKARADGTGSSSGTITQHSSNNNAEIDQTGENQALIDQGVNSRTGGANRAKITQMDNASGAAMINIAGVVQEGSNNTADVGQSGDRNIALFDQTNNPGGAGNSALVSQTGNDNVLDGTQTGENNSVIANQTGDDNVGDAFQSGNDNRVVLTQTGNANQAAIRQEAGNNNEASVIQTASNNSVGDPLPDNTPGGFVNPRTQTYIPRTVGVLQRGSDNKASISQTGNGAANIDQIGNRNFAGVAQSGAGAVFDVDQTGSDNFVTANRDEKTTVTQTGARAQIRVRQTGNTNQAALSQIGDDAFVGIDQIGNSNFAGTTQGPAAVGASSTIAQTGDFNRAEVLQSSFATSEITQSGNNHAADVIQGANSYSLISQTGGNGNVASVTQGAGDWSSVSQTGGANTATVKQN